MNKIASFFLLLILSISAYSQCEVNSYIEANYSLDAKLLALRDILANPSDPDYDNPFLPENRVIPYLELLSGIYENPNNNPEIASLFDDFNFHVNQEYMFPIEYKTLVFRVPTALPWVEDFKTTGISGISELDNLMTAYQFTIDDFWEFNTCSCTIFFVKTGYDFLNLYALIDDFEAIADLDYAEVSVQDFNLRFNYTGIPYSISGESVSVCDIEVQYNEVDDNYLLSFTLYGGDCPAGCTVSESRFVYVDGNCRVLSTYENETYNFSLYPNPADNYVIIKSDSYNEQINVVIFDSSGKKVLMSNNLKEDVLDVSDLKPGLYFIQLTQNGTIQTEKLLVK